MGNVGTEVTEQVVDRVDKKVEPLSSKLENTDKNIDGVRTSIRTSTCFALFVVGRHHHHPPCRPLPPLEAIVGWWSTSRAGGGVQPDGNDHRPAQS
mmetsp:Transcript_50331/g.121826  ORF Transcript_50331/g.121826 Transcript_50331/m.121826 type:complete len:96 (+) Transcript_50331:56-343(+)